MGETGVCRKSSCASTEASGTMRLSSAEQELEILGAQLLHSHLVVVDTGTNHASFLLLEQDHTRLDGVFDAETRDDTRALLADAVATVGGLPLCSRVPPSAMKKVRNRYEKWGN